MITTSVIMIKNVVLEQAKSLKKLMEGSVIFSSFRPSVVIVSSLRRTRQTADHMLAAVDGGPSTANAVYIETPLLNEATPIEYIFPGSLLARIKRFNQWLATCDEILSARGDVLIVGHCQYLKHMLNMKDRFKNCDVYESTFTTCRCDNDSGRCDGQWSRARFLLATPLSVNHPIDYMKLCIFEPAYRYE